MRGIVAFALVLVVAAGSAGATSAAAEPCKDLKVAQAKTVLGASARVAEKVAFGERVCTVRYGGAVGMTVRSEAAADFDWVVAGLQEEPAYVKQLKSVALGDKGYSFDKYANLSGTPTFVPAGALLPGRREDVLGRGRRAPAAAGGQAPGDRQARGQERTLRK